MTRTAASVTGSPEFDYAPGQPNLFRMMKYKQALAAEHGIGNGFDIFRQTFGLPGGVTLNNVPVAGDHQFAREHALFFLETAPAGQVFENRPPPVHGTGNHRAIKGVTRSQFVACIEDAQLHGRASAIQCRGQLLLDFQADERERLDDELEWDPTVFHASGDRAWVFSGFDETPALEVDEAFTLLGAHTDFFGHWMVEYLPKFVTAMLSGALPAVPVLIDAHMPPSHRQSLELLYGSGLQLIEVPAFRAVHVHRLWYAPTLSYMPLHEKRNERFSWDAIAGPASRLAIAGTEMKRLADVALGPAGGHATRVFLARKSFRHRKLTNAPEIQAMAAERGFHVAYPEDLDFAGQVNLMRHASFVIAPEGSALFLTFFSPPGARVCVLSHPLTDVLADYNAVLMPAGVQMCALTGPITRHNEATPHDSDYEIGTDFALFLDQWLAEEADQETPTVDRYAGK